MEWLTQEHAETFNLFKLKLKLHMNIYIFLSPIFPHLYIFNSWENTLN